MTRKPYVQFSKRVVVSVTVAVTVLCAVGMVLSCLGGEIAAMVEIIKAYIGYATVVFAAYSGNSAVEKWLVNKYNGTGSNASLCGEEDESACG